MTTTPATPTPTSSRAPSHVKLDPTAGVEVPKTWKAPIAYAIFGLITFICFGLLGANELVRLSFSNQSDAIVLPDVVTNARMLGIVLGIVMLALAAVAFWTMASTRAKAPLWMSILVGLLFLLALVSWVGAGGKVPITFLLTGALALSVPIVFGGIAGLMCERAGVVNIAIEGQLLAGAFTAAVVSSITHNHTAGLLSAMVAGALVSMVLAVFSIKYLVDQVIVGVVLNALVIGVTNFLYSQFLNDNSAKYNFPGTLETLPIPLLSDIPVLGPLLFDQRITVYLMFVIVPVVWVFLFKTKWGLRVRAVGEHPLAADTVGISVSRTRFWSVTSAGLIAGIGGAALSIGSVGAFVREMSAGQGYIALAALILGRWNPWLVGVAALLFGFSSNFEIWAGQAGSGVPSDLIAMIPYVVTLIAVAGLVGRVRAPAADGQPYIKP